MRRWIVLIILLSLLLGGFGFLLLSGPYSREAVGGLIVGAGCLLLFAGVGIGAGWTAMTMRAGARLAGATHVVAQRADAQRLHLLRDAISVVRSGSFPPSESQQPQAWLPPLTQFDDIVDAEFNQED